MGVKTVLGTAEKENRRIIGRRPTEYLNGTRTTGQRRYGRAAELRWSRH